ncbi:ABC transporter substrate-binding protein [Alkalihalobacillus deserti]|uniref:ABC transporter substrate-binding protein n=1 Tax=Alkalihalobacillus deserti TaxID=2879466 RepID=UPI001D1582A4|nr:ABC transporter substrate-binding protein [Alkalihalobacillus deserti]
MQKRKQQFAVMLVVFLLLLTACGVSDASHNEDGKETLTVAFPWSISGLDPHNTGGNSWNVMRSGAGETLIKLDETLKPTPWLASNWKQEDETTWIFELQENVLFHNGKEMNATSVKDSLLRSIEMNSRANDLLLIESIEVVDEHQLKIKTEQLNSALISHLADPSLMIVDVKTIDEDTSFPALTGAFSFKEFIKDESLTVERFNDYWGEKALLSKVTLKFISDGNTRLMSLQSEDADIAIDIPVDGISLIEQNDQLKVVTAPSMRTHLLLYNINSPFFEDVNFRKMIDQSIPREDIVASIMKGYGTVANSAFTDVLPFGKIEETDPLPSVDRIMTEGGWQKNEHGIWAKEGKLFEIKMLTFPQRPELSVMAEVIQGKLAQQGIKVNIRQVESIDEALAQDDWDVSMYSMLTAHTGDPQYFLNVFYRENSSTNVSNYVSKPLESVIDQLNETTETNRRNELAIEAQTIIQNDVPQSFIVHPETIFGMNQAVQGFLAHPIEYYYIHPQISIK